MCFSPTTNSSFTYVYFSQVFSSSPRIQWHIEIQIFPRVIVFVFVNSISFVITSVRVVRLAIWPTANSNTAADLLAIF